MKTLVLDYGNVISEPQDLTCYDRMSALSGLSADIFRDAFATYRSEYDRGTLSGLRMYRSVLDAAKAPGSEAELDALAFALLTEDLESWSHISREVTAWALSLQASGHPLGILSNMAFEFLERYESGIELFSKADAAVFSCQEALIKPEPEIYQLLLERIDCRPQDIVFFDDTAANVEGARRAGITAFLWTGLDQAKRDWNQAVREA